jgi:hypothetical protein
MKAIKNLSQNIRCRGRDSNRAPPRYKSRSLSLLLLSLLSRDMCEYRRGYDG